MSWTSHCAGTNAVATRATGSHGRRLPRPNIHAEPSPSYSLASHRAHVGASPGRWLQGWRCRDPPLAGYAGRWIEKGAAGWPPLSGLLRVLVVVVARRRCRPPQLEALPAIDRLVRARLERNFRVPAAFGTGRRIHLARAAGIPAATARGVPAATGGVITTPRGIRSSPTVSAGGVPSSTAIA